MRHARVTRTFETPFEYTVGIGKAPAASNRPRPLTHLSEQTRKGAGIMLADSMPDIDLASLQTRCVEFLELCRDDSDTLAHTRLYFIQKAREYGLSNQRIGDALGVTEAAVRNMIKRATPTPECAGCMDSVQPGYTCPECGLYDPNEAS